jgi:hypothetical protein
VRTKKEIEGSTIDKTKRRCTKDLEVKEIGCGGDDS